MATSQERALMDWIRANLGTLNDVRSEQYYDRLKAEGAAGDNNLAAPTPNATRYVSDTLARMLPGASIYASTPAGLQGEPAVGRGGMNFRVGNVSAMYNPDGTLADVVEHKPDSLGFRIARAAMPALAMYAFGGPMFSALGEAVAGTQAAGNALPQITGDLATGAGYATSVNGISLPTGAFGSAMGQAAATLPQITGNLATGAGHATSVNGINLPAGGFGSAQSLTPAAAAATAQAPQPSLVQRALDAGKAMAPYAQVVGPAMSLLSGAQLGSLPQDPNAPRIPGVEAPPEARGLERQDPRAAIVDVLARNRRAGRNPTQLTGSRGVSMASTRIGGTTLLGL